MIDIKAVMSILPMLPSINEALQPLAEQLPVWQKEIDSAIERISAEEPSDAEVRRSLKQLAILIFDASCIVADWPDGIPGRGTVLCYLEGIYQVMFMAHEVMTRRPVSVIPSPPIVPCDSHDKPGGEGVPFNNLVEVCNG